MKKKTIVLTCAICAIIFIVALLIYLQPHSSDLLEVKNLFIDVNGDGLVDLLVEGRVILNRPFGAIPLP